VAAPQVYARKWLVDRSTGPGPSVGPRPSNQAMSGGSPAPVRNAGRRRVRCARFTAVNCRVNSVSCCPFMAEQLYQEISLSWQQELSLTRTYVGVLNESMP